MLPVEVLLKHLSQEVCSENKLYLDLSEMEVSPREGRWDTSLVFDCQLKCITWRLYLALHNLEFTEC